MDSVKNRFVTFEDHGRSGYCVFKDGNKITKFYTEIGGGDCIFYMDIPAKDAWEKATGYSTDERDEILRYVAVESLKQYKRPTDFYYTIKDKHINFFKKK